MSLAATGFLACISLHVLALVAPSDRLSSSAVVCVLGVFPLGLVACGVCWYVGWNHGVWGLDQWQFIAAKCPRWATWFQAGLFLYSMVVFVLAVATSNNHHRGDLSPASLALFTSFPSTFYFTFWCVFKGGLKR